VSFALASVWVGLVLSAMVDLPPSFFVVSVAVLVWGVVLVVTRDRGRRPGAPARGGHDRLPAVPERTR
jgi:zinc/manganese transport system permease protein